MCSILGIFDPSPVADLSALRAQALAQSAKQRHRGPDWSGVYSAPGVLLVHERLAIVDPAGGAQPLRSDDGALALAVNGEIYNHRELERELGKPYAFQTGSDCEVINALYREHGADFLPRLNGIFAFALWDEQQQRYLIARDPLGVCPLYIGHDADDRLYVASEMKALLGVCKNIEVFPPGHYLDSRIGTPVRYWQRDWRDYEKTRGVEVGPQALRKALESAVHRQLMTDVPYGVLLSGGLDSTVLHEGHVLPGAFVFRYKSQPTPAQLLPVTSQSGLGVPDSPILLIFNQQITDAEFAKAKSEALGLYRRREMEDIWLDVDTFKITSAADELKAFQNVTIADVNALAAKLAHQPVAIVALARETATAKTND